MFGGIEIWFYGVIKHNILEEGLQQFATWILGSNLKTKIKGCQAKLSKHFCVLGGIEIWFEGVIKD